MVVLRRLVLPCALLLAAGGVAAEAGQTELRQQPVPGARPGPTVTTDAEGVTVEKSVLRASFHSNFAETIFFDPPLVRAPERKQYLFLLVSAKFPEGYIWDVSGFRLEDGAKQQYPLKAFDSPYERSDESDLAYRASWGVLSGGVLKEQQLVAISESSSELPRIPQRITFMNRVPATTAKLWLVFEIPKPAPKLVLHREIVDITEDALQLERDRPLLHRKPPQTKVTVKNAKPRTWTDSSGQFTVKATLVGAEDGNVFLVKEDDSKISVPFERFSDQNQKYLRRENILPAEELFGNPTTIPKELQAEAEKAFHDGKQIFLWHIDEPKPVVLTSDEPMVRRQIGYAFAPGVPIINHTLRMKVVREQYNQFFITAGISFSPVPLKKEGTVRVKIFDLKPARADYADDFEDYARTVRIFAVPIGARSAPSVSATDPQVPTLSNVITLTLTGHIIRGPDIPLPQVIHTR